MGAFTEGNDAIDAVSMLPQPLQRSLATWVVETLLTQIFHSLTSLDLTSLLQIVGRHRSYILKDNMPTRSWHEEFCRKADVFLVDNVPACVSCGSIYTPNTARRSELNVITPMARDPSPRKKLDLNWPATINFISLGQIEDPKVHASLQWFHRIQEEDSRGTGSIDPNERLDEVERLPDEEIKDQSTENSSKNSVYKPLTGRHEIRLLRLSPALSGDDQVLHGTLLLSQLGDRPEVTALSYTWADISGDRSCSETIFIGPEWEALPITRNCAAALRRLRSTRDAVVVWADAICIDQDNVGERSHQVGLMRDVYSRARKVVAFLGDDGDNQTPEGQLMHRMSEEYFYSGTSVKLSWDPIRDGVALRALFSRPYWKRMWVIQEILLSKEAYIVLGGSSVPLSCVLNGHMTGYNVDAAVFFPSWTKVAGPSLDGDCNAFSELLLKTFSCQALDERDRVFALLGLVQGAHLEGLIADYTKTTEDVYIGLAAYFLIRHGQTNILIWATVSNHSLTWVPTWQPTLRTAQLDNISCDDLWNRPWDILKTPDSRSSGIYGKYEDFIMPGHFCRASAEIQSNGDVLRILQPRVCQITGALMLRAYPVLQIDSNILKNAFSLDQEEWTEEFLLRPSTDTTTQDQDPLWSIHGVRPAIVERNRSTAVEFFDNWIIEVPNCNAFFLLKPRGLVPGLYRMVSIQYLTLLSDIDTKPLMSLAGRKGNFFNDHMLLLRLIMFESHQLHFLQSWSTLMEKNAAVHPIQATAPVSLSDLKLMHYTDWLNYLKFHPTSPTGPVVAESSRSLDSALKTVSSYLDAWADLTIWDCITKLLDSMNWPAYVERFAALRRDIMLDITAPPRDPQHGDKVYHSFLVDKSFSSRGEMCSVLSCRARHLLQDILEDLMREVDHLELPGLSGETMYLGTYKISDTAYRLSKVVDDIASWDIEIVVAKQDEILREWIGFESHLRHMQFSTIEYMAIRNKFIQRHVLRRLYTRCELREFLIC